MPILLDFSMD